KLKRTLKGQRGFSLLELVVALTLLAVISGGIMMAFDGSRSRAQALISSMSELGNAQLRLKNDTGCFVNMPVALFDRTAALDAA
ncbi:type II secretion system protein, partial [Vibrio cholerae]|uniref:type II secretion system protein n=1 Tax=Vibrio cholerae TaxID=666 RepID=UPI00301DAF2F